MNKRTNWIDEPFLLVYDSRSGSTFLANLLVKHLGAAIPPETNFITALLAKYGKKIIEDKTDLQQVFDIVYTDTKFSDWQIEREELNVYIQPSFPFSLRDFILQVCTLYRHKNYPNSSIFGLKKGAYLLKYKPMKEIFPSAKFIEIIRDGRAVFNSKKHSIYSATGQPFETDPYRAAQEWCKMSNLFREVTQKYPTETISIQYEQMIQYPEKIIALLSQFLNVSPFEQSHEKSYIVSERYGDLHKNINKQPLQERIDAWQTTLTAKEIYAFETVAYRCLLSAGYKLANNQFILANKPVNKIWQYLK